MAGDKVLNGVNVTELGRKAETLKKQPDLAAFRFRVSNKWISCGQNRTTVKDFDGVGETHAHAKPFQIDADEPPVLLGQDKGANPVEHLLNALAGCLTSSIAYHAAARGIEVKEIESQLEGTLDVRGFMGIAPDVRKGYQNIKVTFHVKSDAPPEKIKELCQFSPVFDVVSHGTNVEIEVKKK